MANTGIMQRTAQLSTRTIALTGRFWQHQGQTLTARSVGREAHTHAAAVEALEIDDEVTDTDRSLEDEFELERTSRSLASLFDDESEVLTVDATQTDETLQLANCGLSDVTVKALEARGITALFPIQKAVFEPARAGRDLIGRARTGSGKTLAFSLPVIENLYKENDALGSSRPRRGRAPRCIVLAPTRELAKQVEREFQASGPGLTVGCYYGGVPIEQQKRDLRSGLDVVVGTPGRIIDLINRGDMDLSKIQYVILDEADQMLNDGFEEEVEDILTNVPEQRQTLMFSATMPQWVKKLTRRFQKDPVLVDLVGDDEAGKMAETIRALACQVAPDARRSVLVDLLLVHGAGGKAIIFTQTKREADEVAAAVAGVLPCEALHGDIAQKHREKILQDFRDGKFVCLVATDVAARGLDIANVDLVVHYELPQEVESFLHRSGRTGRAGKSGTTVAMFTKRETQYFRRIVRETKIDNIEYIAPPSAAEVMNASAKQVLHRLDNIDPDVKKFFQPAAELVLASADPQSALAAALAALSGLKEVPKPRSLLTQEVGAVTMRVLSRPGRITQAGHIMTIVRNVLGDQATREVGRIRMLLDGELHGAAFDLSLESADKLLENMAELEKRGFTLDRPKSLPIEEERGFDSGRDSRRGGNGGYGRSGRGGDRARSGGGGGRDGFRGGRSSYGGGGGGGRDSYGGGDRYGARGSSRSGADFGRGGRGGGRDFGSGGGGGRGGGRRSYGGGPSDGW
ncbi:hypothetical protein WJX72_006359 [[Myrmecia] bisecta]|uniref:RNA helicase n=1 Tax=[Myrmecia] bisecta TaxID=41462 RepID=A0AAW1PDZ6_9CHLO